MMETTKTALLPKRVSFDDSIQEEVIEIPIDLDNCQK